MVHVCIAPVPPLILEKTATLYQENTCHQRPKNFLSLLTVSLVNSITTYEDAPSNEKGSESSFLEEFSIGLLWPAFTVEFLSIHPTEALDARFDHYLRHFKTRSIEPALLPPI
ncbi:MAG TPA: hypothetical protein DCR35_21615 [Runella sp.]|nr:hypothetical protein [Runella sp.]HAO51685.1 hypothetical protein [Runella sp.]